MTTDQMKYFLTVARCLSFTEAAEQLFLSQPALSRQISALERELAAPITRHTEAPGPPEPVPPTIKKGLPLTRQTFFYRFGKTGTGLRRPRPHPRRG